jgi:hypothetical protein
MIRAFHNGLLVTLSLVALCAPMARAQSQQQGQDQSQNQDQSSQPIPAYHSPLASAADNGQDTSSGPQQLVPDTRPLTGVEDLSIGMPATQHSYWQPRVDFYSTLDTNPLNGSGNDSVTGFTSIVAGIDLHRISGNSNFTLNYTGGGSLSNDGNSTNGVIQGLNLTERLAYRRYAISFFDQFLYSPQTALGSTPIPGTPGLPGSGSGGGLGNGYTPGQSILTTRGQRLTNTSDGEVDAYLTARSSMTFVGGYSILNTSDDSQLNYGNVIFSAGYNYLQSRANTFGLSYQYSSFNYNNFDQSIKNNIISLSYGRRVTGKLAFQISGGPDIAFVHMPIPTSPGTIGGTGGGTPGTSTATTQVYASINTSLQYHVRQLGITASYYHGVSGGSGVLAGSITDSTNGMITRQLSRTFSGSWNVGYSRNRGLQVAGGATASQVFDYWFTGVNLNHPWGRSMNLTLGYQLQYQSQALNTPGCTGAACGTTETRNQITFGLGWHRQPIPF